MEKEHLHYGNDTYRAHKVKKGAVIVHADYSNEVITATADDDLSQIQSDNEVCVLRLFGKFSLSNRTYINKKIY